MDCDIYQTAEQLNIRSEQITRIKAISQDHGHHIWRVHTTGGSYILKCYPDEQSARIEIEAYKLLKELEVPTLPVHGITSRALLLEDLGSSARWRLASEDDLSDPQVGAAVGRWYKTFHERGCELLAGGHSIPQFLRRESEALNVETLLDTGTALDLVDHPVWQAAADHIFLLKKAESRLSQTLNYNDFYWTNLALSYPGSGNLEVVVFDYHLLGVGMRYSDCRNATGSLGSRAAVSFWDEYGSIDPREVVIDKPLSTLYALLMAAQRPKFPSWARESRERLVSGDLLRDLDEAVELAQIICQPAV